MEWLSKSYRLDTEVIAELDRLASAYGSVNKGLRAALLPNGTRGATINPTLPPHQPDDMYNVKLREIPGVSVGLPEKKDK